MDLWLALTLVGAGIVCYIIETMNPGFFIAVPGTVLIVVGALGVLAPDIYDFAFAWVAIIVLAAVTAYATMRVYRRIAPPGMSTTTTSVDNIVGRRGVTVSEVNATQGEVRIEGEGWRARSPVPIPAGTRIEVTGREGNLVLTVHRLSYESSNPK